MFDKRERIWTSAGDPDAIAWGVARALEQRNIGGTVTKGGALEAFGRSSSGVRDHIRLRSTPAPGGHWVDVEVTGEMDRSTVVIFILFLVLFWPIALVMGYLAWDGFRTTTRDYLWTVSWALGQLDEGVRRQAPASSPYRSEGVRGPEPAGA